MTIGICLTVLTLLAGVWNLGVAIWGCLPKNHIKTVGTLEKVKHYKNLHTKYGFVPNWCECVYVYRVGKKTYHYNIGEKKNKNALFKKVEIVYVKGFPKRAGIEKYRSDEAFVIAGGLCLLGLFWLMIVLFA